MNFKTLAITVAVLFSSCCCPNKYTPCWDPPCLPACPMPCKKKVALVLGSGGSKGIAHLGVIEELTNAGIEIDFIVGCSAGSIIGALYADYLDPDYIRKIFAPAKTDEVLDICLWTARYGLSQGKCFRKWLASMLKSRTFEELQMPFYLVTTDLCTGELVVIGSGPLIPAITASSCIPLVWAPVQLHGRIFVDGGVVNPVPVCVARDLGAEIVIAVDLGGQIEQKFPSNLIEVATRSANITLLWQSESCCQNADFVIKPAVVRYGTFDDKHKLEIYEAGRVATRELITAIEEKINSVPDTIISYGTPEMITPPTYKPAQAQTPLAFE